MNKHTKQQVEFFKECNIDFIDVAALVDGKMKNRLGIEIVKLDAYLKWLKFENTKGADIYIRPHRHNSNAVIFLDDVTQEQALAISRKYAACIVETSKEGGCHIWLQTDLPLNERERYLAQRYLQPLINSDRGSISGEHFGRLAGFKNYKRGGCWVNVIAVSNSLVWQVPKAALVDDKPQPISFPHLSPTGGGVVHVFGGNGGGSESESEWGYICGRLEHGADPIILEIELLNRAEARGKRNAKTYAKKTVQKAMGYVRHVL